MLWGFNVSQLWGKGHREREEHFPESFLVLTNTACSSGKCLFFHCSFYFQSLLFSLCSKAIFPPGPGGKLLHPSFLTFFTVINLDNTNSKRKKSKAICIPSTQRQLLWILFLSYIYYLLLIHNYENWEHVTYTAFSFDKTS